MLWSHNLLNIHPRKILNTDLILRLGIFQKALVKHVRIEGIFPGVKTIAKSWTRYTLFCPRLSPVRGEVSLFVTP